MTWLFIHDVKNKIPGHVTSLDVITIYTMTVGTGISPDVNVELTSTV
jgi:hypothetical protein